MSDHILLRVSEEELERLLASVAPSVREQTTISLVISELRAHREKEATLRAASDPEPALLIEHLEKELTRLRSERESQAAYGEICKQQGDEIARLRAEVERLRARETHLLGAITDAGVSVEIARLRAEVERLREIVAEFSTAGVEFEDERVSYVTVQISRSTWLDLRRSAAKGVDVKTIGEEMATEDARVLDSLRADNNSLRDQLTRQSAELEELRAACTTEADEERAAANATADRFMAENESLRAELAETKARLEAAEKERDRLRDYLALASTMVGKDAATYRAISARDEQKQKEGDG